MANSYGSWNNRDMLRRSQNFSKILSALERLDQADVLEEDLEQRRISLSTENFLPVKNKTETCSDPQTKNAIELVEALDEAGYLGNAGIPEKEMEETQSEDIASSFAGKNRAKQASLQQLSSLIRETEDRRETRQRRGAKYSVSVHVSNQRPDVD